jgi:hypothetical protein
MLVYGGCKQKLVQGIASQLHLYGDKEVDIDL